MCIIINIIKVEVAYFIGGFIFVFKLIDFLFPIITTKKLGIDILEMCSRPFGFSRNTIVCVGCFRNQQYEIMRQSYSLKNVTTNKKYNFSHVWPIRQNDIRENWINIC